MTSKTELKELIEALRDEVKELKNEIEVLKTMIEHNKTPKYPCVTAAPKINIARTTGADYSKMFPAASTSTARLQPTKTASENMLKSSFFVDKNGEIVNQFWYDSFPIVKT